jgi:hypothetical protein
MVRFWSAVEPPGQAAAVRSADGALPTASLRRALTLAQALEVKVHVLRVVFGRWPLIPASPQVDLLASTRFVEHVVQSERSLREWLAGLFPAGSLAEEVCTRSGDFIRHVAARAREVDAALIVVPPGERHAGELAATLACEVQLPVFVARDGTFRQGIMAATDLRDPTYPVLRMAESLRLQLGAPVIALHNLSPQVLNPAGGQVRPRRSDTACSGAREQLERALSLLSSQSRRCGRAGPCGCDLA